MRALLLARSSHRRQPGWSAGCVGGWATRPPEGDRLAAEPQRLASMAEGARPPSPALPGARRTAKIASMSVTYLPPLDRKQAAAAVLAAKRRSDVRWADLGTAIGRSAEWTTAALLGQHPLTAEQAATLGSVLDLDAAVVEALTLPPVRGRDVVDTSEPIVYRFQEMVQVYGNAITELVREEFGDGIVSAIDFELTLDRVPDPKGDRVRITLNGKFLPYRSW